MPERETETSLALQLNACQAKAESLGATVTNVDMEIDSGLAGLQNRVELRDAISQVTSGQADALVCLDMTRIARAPEVLAQVQARLLTLGQLIYAREKPREHGA